MPVIYNLNSELIPIPKIIFKPVFYKYYQYSILKIFNLLQNILKLQFDTRYWV